MEINLEAILTKKELNKLRRSWSKFIDKKNYSILNNLVDINKERTIIIQDAPYFLKKSIKDDLIKFVDNIYNNDLIKNVFCYDSISESVINEITTALNNENKSLFNQSIDSISTDLSKKVDNHLFYFPLIGFVLSNIKDISIGDVTIIHFDESNHIEILNRSVTTHKVEHFTESVISCIKENFIGKSVIIISSYGDRIKSEQIAREKAKIVVNYFRFITCLLAHERIDENLIKISLESAWPSKNDPFFYETKDKTEYHLANDRGRRPLQNFEFTTNRLCELKKEIFFDDLCDFVFRKEKTELEKCILTAIYWIGEAQNDHDRESSFLKYCIALESILTDKKERRPNPKNEYGKKFSFLKFWIDLKKILINKKENTGITHTLCKGISILLSFGGYEFIDQKDIKITYNKISKLYDARSYIVHEGLYGKVSAQDLNDICKFSSWSILCLFWLRNSHAIKSMSEIKYHIDKLYRDHA
jgi:hypothetical protein